MVDIWRRNHAQISLKNLVPFFIGQEQIILVSEFDIRLFHGFFSLPPWPLQINETARGAFILRVVPRSWTSEPERADRLGGYYS